MDLKVSLAGLVGMAVFAACGGSHKLGDGNQASQGAGGADGGSVGGSKAGALGGQGGDPSFGGLPGGGGTTSATPGITIPSINDPTPWLAPSGNWAGYVENYKFPSGSDALLFAAGTETGGGDSGGVQSAELTLGQGSGALPSPSDVIGIGGGPGSGVYDIVEGHPYTVVNGSIVGMRLQFDISTTEIWSAYCASLAPQPGTTSCAPSNGFSSNSSGACWITVNGTQEPADCTELVFCSRGICICDQQHCFVNPTLVHFDMTLTSTTFPGGHYDGSVASLPGAQGVLNVHFLPPQ